jgi:hypothetical protein
MKKALITFGIILITLSVMAPGPPDKAEKLRVDNNHWDRAPYHSDFTIDMSCQFGMATAAEHNGKFTVNAYVDIFEYDNQEWDKVGSTQELGIAINKGPEPKGTDGFIAIDPATLSWNGDDDGSQKLKIDVTLNLIGPSGNVLSSTFIEEAATSDPIGGADIPCTASPGSP